MSIIQIDNLTRDYGRIRALDNLSLTIEPNKIYGLLGRNGAGKTTLLNLITNKAFPTSGQITIAGENVIENDRVLGKIFYMMEKNLYPEGIRIREVFKWTKEFYPSFDPEYATALADKFGLKTNRKVKGLSTGYTSIFKAILALASNAEIVMFDEPVLGLDANHRDLLYKEILANYIESPKTIIISTHLIEEIADIIEEVIIINEGKLIRKQSVEELLSTAYTVSGEATKVDKYIGAKQYIDVETLGKFKSVTVVDHAKDEALAKELDVELSTAKLQKLFISLTNN